MLQSAEKTASVVQILKIKGDNHMTDILNTPIGSPKKDLTITDIITKTVNTTSDGSKQATKVVLTCADPSGIDYQIDEAWILDYKTEEPTHKGLWVSKDPRGRLDSQSTLVQLLNFLKVNTPAELVGKDISTWPKKNGYKAIIACNHSNFKE